MYRVSTFEQRSPEWYAERAELTTASMFSTVCERVGGLTPQQQKYVDALKAGMEEPQARAAAGYKAAPKSKTIEDALAGKDTTDWSQPAKDYMHRLVMARIGGPVDERQFKAWQADRGIELEAVARAKYEARTGFMVNESGLLIDDERGIGYSPDGMVDPGRLLEIKCPSDPEKVIALWRGDDPAEYRHQIQGGLGITGREVCDLVIYTPQLKSLGADMLIIPIERDESFISTMMDTLARFNREAKELEARLRSTIIERNNHVSIGQ